MGGHVKPASWLERWREQEPLRLWLGTVAAAVIVLAVGAGWVTQELAVGIAGVVSAVLMLGAGWWPVRSQVYPEASLRRLLEEQHALSYHQGQEDLQVELARPGRHQMPAHMEERATEQMPAVEGGATAHLPAVAAEERRQMRMCPFMEADGRRCTLPEHRRRVPHRMEGAAQE